VFRKFEDDINYLCSENLMGISVRLPFSIQKDMHEMMEKIEIKKYIIDEKHEYINKKY